jgi:superfamily II DNA/RNA helicase
VTALARRGITEPLPIQAAALPDALAGEHVLGRARTGSGKTLGFGLPMLARLAADAHRVQPGHPRGLVLVPTRELAQQVADALEPLARVLGLWVTTVYGGASLTRQVEALRRGAGVVVATPGRLTDLIERRACDLGQVEITVVDEADHMCDLGFLPVVRRLLSQVPVGGQRMLFSATLDGGVDVLVREHLHGPVLVAVDPQVQPAALTAHHGFEAADKEAKLGLVTALAGGRGRTLVFARTKHGADRLARQLAREGIPAAPLHGGMAQNARSRALRSFCEGSRPVLVATDVAARGIHVDDVELVVHADPPAEHKAYLHRSGRTARAGAAGTVVVVLLPEERRAVEALLRAAGLTVTIERVTGGHPRVRDVVGPARKRVEDTGDATMRALRPAVRAVRSAASRKSGRRRVA